MTLEEQLLQIAKVHGLAALNICVHNADGLEPWIAVSTQITVAPGKRVQGCGGSVREPHGIIPAIHKAIAEMHAIAAAYHGVTELAPLADGEGEAA